MNFAIACLAAFAVLACASASVQPTIHAGLHSLFNNARITNGQDAVPNSRQWQVSYQQKTGLIFGSFRHICGGSIINELWVITAAHCILSGQTSQNTLVLAGAHNLNKNEPTQQSRETIGRFKHPGYKGGVGPDDIAVIKVARPFVFNDAVAPIALPLKNTVHTGNAVLSGWGSVSTTSSPIRPSVLQTVSVPIVSTQACYTALNALSPNPPLDVSTLDNVCTGPLDSSGISACSGDSGGPLAQLVNGVWELVGQVSWGLIPCGAHGAPSVYARTSAYTDWIEKTIGN